MEERSLGRTGLRVTVVTLGAMGLGPPGPGDDGRLERVIRASLDAGVTAIDTAPLYGFGRSERIVGRVIASRAIRPRVLTKVGLRWDDPSGHGEPLFEAPGPDGGVVVVRRDGRPESILLEIERSLARLAVDALDLVQVHHRDRRVPLAETMGALREAVRAGSVRHVGVSNFSRPEIAEARAALADVPLASVQSPLSLLSRSPLPGVLRAEVGFLAYSPLAQGLLGGAYPAYRDLAPGDWRASLPLFAPTRRAAIARTLEETVRPIAERRGVSLAQIALAWVIAQPGVSAAVAGASDEAQARQNAAAGSLALEAAELRALERAFDRLAEPGRLRRAVRRWLRR